jgi:hypothetical protein
MYYTKDDGNNWTADTNLKTFDVESIVRLNTTTLLACGYQGVYRSTNNGKTWAAANSGLPIGTIGQVLKVVGSTVYLGTDGFYISTNGGQTWAATGSQNIGSVFNLCINGKTIFAGTWQGIYLSNNNGNSWTAINKGLTNTYVSNINMIGSSVFASTWGGMFGLTLLIVVGRLSILA